jgi:hypothetical protein
VHNALSRTSSWKNWPVYHCDIPSMVVSLENSPIFISQGAELSLVHVKEYMFWSTAGCKTDFNFFLRIDSSCSNY